MEFANSEDHLSDRGHFSTFPRVSPISQVPPLTPSEFHNPPNLAPQSEDNQKLEGIPPKRLKTIKLAKRGAKRTKRLVQPKKSGREKILETARKLKFCIDSYIREQEGKRESESFEEGVDKFVNLKS